MRLGPPCPKCLRATTYIWYSTWVRVQGFRLVRVQSVCAPHLVPHLGVKGSELGLFTLNWALFILVVRHLTHLVLHLGVKGSE